MSISNVREFMVTVVSSNCNLDECEEWLKNAKADDSTDWGHKDPAKVMEIIDTAERELFRAARRAKNWPIAVRVAQNTYKTNSFVGRISKLRQELAEEGLRLEDIKV